MCDPGHLASRHQDPAPNMYKMASAPAGLALGSGSPLSISPSVRGNNRARLQGAWETWGSRHAGGGTDGSGTLTAFNVSFKLTR